MENIKDKAKQDLTDLINTKSELNAFNEAYNKAKTSEEAPSLTTEENLYLKEITHNITDVEKVNLANALREHKWSSSENKQTTEKKHQIADFLTLQVLQKESINDFKGNVLNTVAENEREKTKERFGEKQDIYEERTKKLLRFIPFGKEKVKTGEEIIVRDQEAKQYIENLTKFIQNKQGKSEDLLHITNSFNPNSNVSKAIIEQTAKVQSEQIGTVFGEKENLPETLSEILHNQQTFSEYAKSFNENSLAKATLDRLKEPEKKDRKLDLAETNNGLNRAMERKDTTVNAVANKVKADELNTQAQKIEVSTKFAQVYGKIETQNSEQRKTTQKINNSKLKM